MDYEKQGIEKSSLIEKAKKIHEVYDLFGHINDDLKAALERIPDPAINDALNEIIDGLVLEKMIVEKESSFLQSNFSLDKIKQSIVTELKLGKNFVSEHQLKGIIKQEFPVLDFVPDFIIWKTALQELEHEKIIKIYKRSNLLRSSQISLNVNYEKIQRKSRNLDPHNTKFYGRNISPDTFVRELLELETGDIGAHDDQVTHICGLILSDSIKLIPPREKSSEFDFVIDITDYSFRKGQLAAMKNLDFQIHSDIFHCKVMIDEILTLDKLKRLTDALPFSQQGIVFTFKKIPEHVKSILQDEQLIQIIDEKGLKTWMGTRSTTPSRKNSIAKLHFDPVTKLERKLVKINSIDYERGLATVSIFPEMSESTVLVRSLEEITLNEPNASSFETYANNYFEFLNMLSKLTSVSNLIEGMFNQKIQNSVIHTHNSLEMKFEHHHVKLSLISASKNRIAMCDCMAWAEDKFYLCPHLVSSFDHAFRTFSKFNESWAQNNNEIKCALQTLFKNNISIILERLGLEYNSKKIKGDKKIIDFVNAIVKIRKNS